MTTDNPQNQSKTSQTPRLLAFHGDPKIKRKYIARVRAHREAEHLTQGVGFEPGHDDVNTRGCAVGCTLNAYDVSRYPDELGVPIELGQLEDCIFESMPWSDPSAEMDAQRWPEAVLAAIRPGADLSAVASAFRRGVALEAVLTHWPEGKYEQQEGDRELVVAWLASDDESFRGDARAAASAAYAAYAAPASAAYASAAASAYAAPAAAASAASAAASAAADAADAVAASAAYARRAHWQHMAGQLLRLLAKAPVPKAVPT